MTEQSNMQVATYQSSALTMPTEEFIEFFMQPIEDDTWIRREDIVKLDNLLENTQSMEKKREILKEYIEERAKLGPVKPDPILEGMLNQEKFMEEYIVSDHKGDADKASYYRQQLMNKFRRTHPDRPVTVPFGEEDTDVESTSSDAEKEEKVKRQAELEHQRRIAAGESSESSRNASNVYPQEVEAAVASEQSKQDASRTNETAEEANKEIGDKVEEQQDANESSKNDEAVLEGDNVNEDIVASSATAITGADHEEVVDASIANEEEETTVTKEDGNEEKADETNKVEEEVVTENCVVESESAETGEDDKHDTQNDDATNVNTEANLN